MENPILVRPTWDEYFSNIVQLTSSRSSCNKLNVGCLLVKENRIISQGYNGYLPGFKHEAIIENGHNIGTIHAEQNALLDCAKRGVSCNGCTAYITHTPCFTCTKMMLGAGISNIKYLEEYKTDDKIFDLAKKMNVRIVNIGNKLCDNSINVKKVIFKNDYNKEFNIKIIKGLLAMFFLIILDYKLGKVIRN